MVWIEKTFNKAVVLSAVRMRVAPNIFSAAKGQRQTSVPKKLFFLVEASNLDILEITDG